MYIYLYIDIDRYIDIDILPHKQQPFEKIYTNIGSKKQMKKVI